MESISNLAGGRTFKIVKTSERAELLRFFLENLKDQKGKQFSPSYLGMRVSHLNIEDLYFLQKMCQNSDNFGRCFWGSLKTRMKPK